MTDCTVSHDGIEPDLISLFNENKKQIEKRAKRRKKRHEKRTKICHCCGNKFLFCWNCRKCGFSICQQCMYENQWGMTCNGITWQCPDCGEQNGFGNQ